MLVKRDPARTSGVGAPEINDLERRVSDVVKYGVVKEADYASVPPRLKVGIGDPDDADGYILTGWLPMGGGRSDEWNPIKVNEAVTVLSESGEIQNGVVLPGSIYNTDNPAPGDRGDLYRKKFPDGSVIEYDEASGEMKMTAKTKKTLVVGDATITMQNGSIVLSAGGQTLTIGGAGANSSGKITGNNGLDVTGGDFKHNGHDVGSTHHHLNSGGSGLGGVPQ